ncbi:MAG: flagellar protein FlgN [Oscillospiraceae bacterium]
MLSNQSCLNIISFLKTYTEFYSELLTLEEEKYDIISKNEIKLLDAIVVKEQAMILKSRGIEIERDKIVEKEVGEKVVFSKLLEMFTDEHKQEITDIFNQFSDILLQIKEINYRCKSLTELRLHKIGNAISSIENKAKLKTEKPVKKYDNKGFITKKV